MSTLVQVGPDRHQATHEYAKWFGTDHLQPDQKQVVTEYARLATRMIQTLKDGPELWDGLKALRDSKDCMVRQSLTDHGVVS